MSRAILEPDALPPPDAPGTGRLEVMRRPLWRAGVLGVLAGLLSQVDALPSSARLVLLLAFVCLAPGAAVLVWWRGLSPAAQGGLTPTLGLSVLVLANTVSAFNRWWNPEALVWIVVVATVASSAAAVLVGRSAARPVATPADLVEAAGAHAAADPFAPDVVDTASAAVDDALSSPQTWSWRVARPSLIVLGLALVAWLVCLPTVGQAPASAWGLLVAASPALVVSLVLVIAAGLLALRHRSGVGLLAAAVVMVAVQRLTLSLATEVPIYPWTYKHIAIVDYIDRYHYVVRGTDIYHNWPGLFALTSWADELTGVSPMAIAHWFTPVFHLALLPLVYAAARAWRRTPLVSAATVFVFQAGSFISQDYFSPQALGYLLAFGVVIGLGESAYRRSASIPALVVFAGVVVTHQLTPYWLLLVVTGLVVFRRVRSWWLPVACAAIALGYLYLNYAIVTRYGAVTSTNPLQNIRLTQRAVPLFGFRVAFYTAIVCYLIAFGTTAVVLLHRLSAGRFGRSRGTRRRPTPRREWRAPAVLAFAPILLLAVQGYGGEAIFRVFLYALPGLAPVLATVLLVAFRARLRAALPMVVLAVVLCLAAAQSYLGVYSAYRIDRSQVAMWDTINREAPIGSYLYVLGPGFPGNWQWQYAQRNQRGGGSGSAIFSSDVRVDSDFDTDVQYDDFMKLLLANLRTSTKPIFMVTSTGAQTYGEINGVLEPGSNQNLRRHMLADPRWQLVQDLGSTTLFQLTAAARNGSPS